MFRLVSQGSRWLSVVLLALLVLTSCATRGLPDGVDPTRRVPLSGSLNTRDLGGYPTTGGLRVRRGLLFRSDELSGLDSDDVARLAEIGLRNVFDLRTESEREGELDRLPPGTGVRHLPMSHPSMDPDYIMERILWGRVPPDYFRGLISRANRSFALEHGSELAELTRALTQPGALPALFHCTYGKDRTGFASAMILEALGVPWETVVEDYLLSNVYLESRIDRMSRLIWFASRFRISRDHARDLLGVRREYLEAAREAILQQYGSVLEYWHAIGLDEVTLARLRDALLEPGPAAPAAEE